MDTTSRGTRKSSRGGKSAILVVEDHAGVRRLISGMLKTHGFIPLEAESAAQGLALFSSHEEQIGLAIVDMVMPGTSGLDLAAELERLQAGVKILYISGYVDSLAMESIARKDPESVLLKPFTDEALIERVIQLQERPSKIAPSSAVAGTERRARDAG